ncbi:hypothetical protein BC941DRAFT_463057 [Chlamydoabsidia padenii]|nr:hypothetical protein BC941DRAFT_463057 [Chlamydoabsidia padenii]
MYKGEHDLTDNESLFNHTFIYPYLVAVAAASVSGYDFVPGETYLKSMTKQLVSIDKHKDERYQYKADGVFRLFEKKDLEILLLETSSSFVCRDKIKFSFDHHKSSFGAMAMLKSITDYKIKAFFVHAAGDQLHLWNLTFKHDGIYELWRGTYLTILPSFGDKTDFLLDFLNFFWAMKELVKETINNIDELAKGHTTIKAKHRYSVAVPVLLTDIIKPSIIKLTQHEGSKGMADLGPFYSPLPSPSQSPSHSPS